MTKGFIDNFSSKSKEYSFSRPVYPADLFTFLSDITPNHDLVWDCATGNGQAAIGLCKHFKKIIASDASKSQIDNKFERENITYKVFPAEKTSLPNNCFGLLLKGDSFKKILDSVAQYILTTTTTTFLLQ